MGFFLFFIWVPTSSPGCRGSGCDTSLDTSSSPWFSASFTATVIPTLGLLSLLLPCVSKLCQDMAQRQSGTRWQQAVLAPLLPRCQVFGSQAFEGGHTSSELGYQ